jgi:hypothetical protein
VPGSLRRLRKTPAAADVGFHRGLHCAEDLQARAGCLVAAADRLVQLLDAVEQLAAAGALGADRPLQGLAAVAAVFRAQVLAGGRAVSPQAKKMASRGAPASAPACWSTSG